jgi:hypothetical protein
MDESQSEAGALANYRAGPAQGRCSYVPRSKPWPSCPHRVLQRWFDSGFGFSRAEDLHLMSVLEGVEYRGVIKEALARRRSACLPVDMITIATVGPIAIHGTR